MYKLLFGVSKISDTIRNAKNYLYFEEDDTILHKYETGDIKTQEELKEKAEKIIKKKEKRRKEGKF